MPEAILQGAVRESRFVERGAGHAYCLRPLGLAAVKRERAVAKADLGRPASLRRPAAKALQVVLRRTIMRVERVHCSSETHAARNTVSRTVLERTEHAVPLANDA